MRANRIRDARADRRLVERTLKWQTMQCAVEVLDVSGCPVGAHRGT